MSNIAATLLLARLSIDGRCSEHLSAAFARHAAKLQRVVHLELHGCSSTARGLGAAAALPAACRACLYSNTTHLMQDLGWRLHC